MNPTSQDATTPKSLGFEREGGRRRHRRPRRSKRRTGRDGRGRARGVLGWASLLNDVLTALEDAAWSLRGAADEVLSVCAEAETTYERVSDVPARVTETALALSSIAADYRLYRLRAAFLTTDGAERLLARIHENSARRFAEVSLRHGGAFLKVGQLLSARPDVMPGAWIEALTPLQDAATPVDAEAVMRVIERELGAPAGDVFASFDPRPLAAASIGQVHRATLKDGREVAVKVQRPGIGERVRADLMLLETFVRALSGSLPDLDVDTILRELRAMILAELDFAKEARATQQAFELLAAHEGIAAAEPVLELCTARVLVTRFVGGRKLTTALDELAARRGARAPDDAAHAELSALLGRLLEAYLRQVLQGGVFQADPHPGNLLVRADGTVTILDFGSAGVLDDETRARYLELLGAAFAGNRARMDALFVSLGFRTKSGRHDTLHLFADALLGELRQALAGTVRWPTRDEVGERMAALVRACADDPVVSLPGEFVAIARVFGTLSGLFTQYAPDLDVARYVLPTVGPAFFSAL